MPGDEHPPGSIEAGVSRLWMADDGVLMGKPIPGGVSTEASVKDVMAAIDSVTGGSRPRLLYDMRELRFVSADARHLAVREFHRFVSAAAVVVDDGVSKLLMDFFEGVDQGEMPIRMFTDMDEARQWLLAVEV